MIGRRAARKETMRSLAGLLITTAAGIALATSCAAPIAGSATAVAPTTSSTEAADPADTTVPEPASPTPTELSPIESDTGSTASESPSGSPAESSAVSPTDDPFAATTDVDPEDFPGTVTPVGFSIPPGDIGCGFQPTRTPSIVCQADHHTYPNPTDLDCQGAGEPGAAITLSAGGRAEFICAGDVESGGPPLAAGNMITIETLQCVGLDQGVACRDSSTDDAFRLTTDSYEITNGNTSTGAGS